MSYPFGIDTFSKPCNTFPMHPNYPFFADFREAVLKPQSSVKELPIPALSFIQNSPPAKNISGSLYYCEQKKEYK